MGVKLVSGRRVIDVDCTNNPAALSESYHENINYKNLQFAIKGDCFGDIRVFREFNDDGTWQGNTAQAYGQSLSIYPQEGQTAGLIPNDLSGSVAIWATLGGGVYLNNLTINMGSDWDYGVAYSRNSHGSVNNVTIVGPETPNGYGIFVQEGAQVYINRVDISNVNTGVFGTNSATVRFLGDSTISSQFDAIRMSGATVRQQGNISAVSAEANRLFLSAGTNWNGEYRNISGTGNTLIRDGSTLIIGSLTGSNLTEVESSLLKASYVKSESFVVLKSTVDAGAIEITDSELRMSVLRADNFSSGTFYMEASSIEFRQGNITSNANVLGRSFMSASDGSINIINLDQHSIFYGENLSISEVYTNTNSAFTLNNSSVNNNLYIQGSSTGTLNNVDFTGSELHFMQSNVSIEGEAKIPTDKLSCSGFSQVRYEGVDDILATAPDSNCLDQSSVDSLMNLIKANHNNL
jgi:hypothetical protein